MQHIRAQGLRFVDEQGRERIFRGVNACEKDVAEEEKSYDRFCLNLDDAFFLRCNALGFNVIRLGLCWEILEPEKGKFNEAYLRSVDEIFRRAAQYGVYIFLDMHQDLYSSFGINCGDGAPLWATLTDGYRAKPAKLVWAEGYFWGKAVQRAFDHFWNNDPVQGLGLQEHFAGLWQMLARRYAGQPAFFGFDLFNEPYPGTEGGRVFRRMIARLLRYALTSPQMHRIKFLKALFAKGDKAKALHFLDRRMLREVTSAADGLIRKFDLERYTPFLNRMTAAVRACTQNGVIMMENSYYSNLGIPYSAEAPQTDGRREENVCFSPHAYDFMVDTDAYAYASNDRVGSIFEEHRRSQERLHSPVLVGEWGGGGEGESWFPHIEFLLNLFDSYAWSNTYYTYSEDFFDQPLMRVLSRPYPVAVNGTLQGFSYDRAAGRFAAGFIQSLQNDAAAESIFYLPRKAERISADPALQCAEEAIPGGEAWLLRCTGSPGEHRLEVAL